MKQANSTGLIFNFLTIVAFGMGQYARQEKDVGIQHMFDKSLREKIAREYPHLNRDTSALVITLLLPYVVLIRAVYELLFKSER